MTIENHMEQPSASALAAPEPDPDVRHHRWLTVIGIFKMFEAAAYTLLGIGALHLLHRDLVEVVNHWIVADLRFNPESHLVNLILNQTALINPHRLKLISAGIFGSALLNVIEGVGLLREKAWAEYVTLILTAAFLPWEFIELLRHFTGFKVGLISLNALLVLYLLWVVQKQARLRAHRMRSRNHHP
jgi:uncharacterized membrane protein (DUF2068 family)